MVSLLFAVVAGLGQSSQPTEQAVKPAVVKYCESHVGQKIGDGECSSLATAALQAANLVGYHNQDSPAPGDYVWGDVVYSATVNGTQVKETPEPKARLKVQAGDVVQFRNVRLTWKKDNTIYREKLDHHTAIIASVTEKGLRWKLYQQNADGRRYVVTEDMYLPNINSGYFTVYRPTKG